MKFFLRAIVAIMTIVTPHIARADMNFFDRIMFSDKAYAKEIEVKAYIITQEQACTALCDPQQEVIQLSKKELGGNKTYLFLKVKNMSNKHAWGTLACKVPRYHGPIKVSVGDLDNQKNYNIYLLHLGSLAFIPSSTGIPEISVEWDELYAE
jgi:hypothetical protein